MLDVDVEHLPAAVELGGHSGVTIRVEHRGRVVGYVLRSFQPGAIVGTEALDDLIARGAAVDIVRDSLEQELRAGLETPTDVPTLTVAVCTRQRAERLRRCLVSILQATHGREGVDILVVDNAPADTATHDVVDELGSVGYVVEPRAGLDFARNRAVSTAEGELLAFVDDDVVVHPHWVDRVRGAFVDQPDAECVTGLVLPFATETEAQVRFELRGGFRRGFERLRHIGPDTPGDRVFPFGAGRFGAGCNMAFRTSTLDALGGFDNALDTGPPLPGGGDIDMFFRVLRAGSVLVYEPGAVVFHEHRRDMLGLRRQYRSWGEGFMAFLGKCWQEPGNRSQVLATTAWWARYELRMLALGLLGRNGMRADLAVAEAAGGLLGACGGYPRSRRRVTSIDDAVSSVAEQ
jgi:glycosyltransferase involved in cell wall biosynthesis